MICKRLNQTTNLLHLQPEGIAGILAIGAAIGAAAALAWNTQQPSTSDFNKLKDRVTSLETDQTAICTTVRKKR